MSEILIRPLVTEKMTSIQDRQGKFGFVVKQSANKIEIKKAIERYGIDRYKALNYADDRKDEASSLKKGLNSFERDLASMGKRDREEYLDEIGNSIDDYPNLRRYLESRGESLE